MQFGRLGLGLGRLGFGGGGAAAIPGVIAAGAGGYTWSGELMAPIIDHRIAAAGGSYVYAGQSASVIRDALLSAAGGSYTYTGQDATLTVGAGSFDPTSLFPAAGGWWDVAAAVADGTIYTDDGVTAATTDGQTIYRLNDRSGNGRNLIQATAASRPTLRNSGALWWLEFDGTDDFIQTATFTLDQPLTRINAFSQTSWTSLEFVWDGTLNSMRLYQSGSSPNLVMRGSAVGPGNTGATIGTNRVSTEIVNGASSSLKIDNGTAATGDVGTGNPGRVTIGSNGSGAANANIKWFGGIWIAGSMASGDQNSCRTYFGNLAGLSL